MKSEIKIPVRAYSVKIRDERTGEKMDDTIIMEKAKLQAGAMVGLGDEDIIYRLYNRQGFRVLQIGEVHKTIITIDLNQAYNELVAEEYLAMEEQMASNAVQDGD
ncbi:MAG: hypothetical protein E7575_06395 [Ruminococcaceae bacterium]|nr:hypothetical protein [Oscillospiraceae bacterium]MBE6984886.1 hypothetical protein [Oscillospiraceae bacterium]